METTVAAPLAEPLSGIEAAPAWTVLCVDDEPNIISALRRLFRGSGYRVLSAGGGREAIGILESHTVDLIISDMRMPGMDGAQLLEQVRARWPATTRLLLTGDADVQSTVAAINRGEVYRYITKPWNDGEILLTVREAFEHQALLREKLRLEVLTRLQNRELGELNATLEQKVQTRTAELSLANDKLGKNYLTSIKAFSNLIELRGGRMLGHTRRVADLARRTAQAMNLSEADWRDIFVAGLLHDIGHIGLADTLLASPIPRLSDDELALYRKHPMLGEQALMALDDMQRVATLIRSHHERHDGQGFPDKLAGHEIAAGARILAVADAFDDLQNGHLGGGRLTTAEARTIITRGRGTQFEPETVDVFLQVCIATAPTAAAPPRRVSASELRADMVLAKDLVSAEGVVLLTAGQRLSADFVQRICRYAAREGAELALWILVTPAE